MIFLRLYIKEISAWHFVVEIRGRYTNESIIAQCMVRVQEKRIWHQDTLRTGKERTVVEIHWSTKRIFFWHNRKQKLDKGLGTPFILFYLGYVDLVGQGLLVVHLYVFLSVMVIGIHILGSRTVGYNVKFKQLIIFDRYQGSYFSGNQGHSFATFNIICWAFSTTLAFSDTWEFSEPCSWSSIWYFVVMRGDPIWVALWPYTFAAHFQIAWVFGQLGHGAHIGQQWAFIILDRPQGIRTGSEAPVSIRDSDTSFTCCREDGIIFKFQSYYENKRDVYPSGLPAILGPHVSGSHTYVSSFA